MKRRTFLASTAATIPVLAFNQGFNNLEEGPKEGFVVKANESRFGEKTKVNGLSPNDIKVSSKDTNGNLTVFEYIGNEKGGPPLHMHLSQDEVFFIIEGEYTFQVGDDKHLLKGGDTIFLPRKVAHAFAQTSEKGKMYFMFTPSGRMEDFFRAIGALKEPPPPELGAKIFADHEMQVVGPPLQF